MSLSTPVSSPGEQEKNEHPGPDSKLFFGHPAYLTVSGQLHLEAITGLVKAFELKVKNKL